MSDLVRFGIYEFNPASGSLRRDGSPVKLQTQPARVLAVLLAQAGETVSRDTLQREVWGDGTHVDFERGLNFCIAQVRSALGDTADSPRYIVTVPRVGYRFIAPVLRAATAERTAAPIPETASDRPVHSLPSSRVSLPRTAAVAFAVLVLASGGWKLWRLVAFPAVPTVVVVPFYNETGLIGTYAFGSGLTERLVVSRSSGGRLVVTREGEFDRFLFHHGGRVFNPSGAEAVRIRFEPAIGPVTTLAVVDGPLTVRASAIARTSSERRDRRLP